MRSSERISRFFRTGFTYADPLDMQQAQNLNLVAWGGIALLVIASLIQFADGVPANHILIFASLNIPVTDTTYAAHYLITAVLFFLTIQLVNRGALGPARVLYVGANLYFAIVLYMLIGVLSFALTVVIMPVASAGVLLRRRGILATAVVIGMSLIVLNLFARVGLYSLILSRELGLADMLLLALEMLAVISFTLGLFGGGQRLLLSRNIALANELRSLTALSSITNANSSTDEMLNLVVESMREQLGFFHVQIFVVEEVSGLITLAAGTAIGRPTIETSRRRFSPDSPGIVSDVARTRQPRRITLASPPMLRTEFLSATRAEVLLPIIQGDTLLGVLDVQSAQSEGFSDQDVTALEAIASQIAMAIQNRRQSSALAQTERDRAQLSEQNKSALRDVERLNREISGRAWVSYLEGRADRAISYSLKDGLLSAEANPVWDAPNSLNPSLETRGGAQWMVIPITLRGQTLGVMEFRAPGDQGWDEPSIELGRIIAQRLALSLDNLRLFEQAQMAVAREQMANQVASVLQTRSEVDSLVKAAVEAFQQALGATKVSVNLGTPSETRPKKPAALAAAIQRNQQKAGGLDKPKVGNAGYSDKGSAQ